MVAGTLFKSPSYEFQKNSQITIPNKSPKKELNLLKLFL